MTESGQGSGQHRAPQSGVPQGGEPWGQPGYGYPQPEPEPGHVVGPGFEGPGQPHGYGYPPLPEAVTQYIPPVPPGPGPGQHEAATQYIPPVPSGPGPGQQHEAATQYMPPVPSGPGPGQHEAATQFIPPVPSGPGPGQHEAATQFIPPVPSGPGPGAGQHDAATQFIPPVPAGPGAGQHEAATQYIPPVPSGPGPGTGQHEAATQYIPPVPSGPGPGTGQHDAATQYIPPVPPGPAPNAAEGFDGLFRNDAAAGQTQHLPPVQAPVRRQQPPPRAYPQQHPQPAAQQYAPPPPAETGRRVSPLIIGAVVVGLAVVGLGVGALLSDGKPQNTDPGAAPAAPTGSGSAEAAGEDPVDPARPQAVQLDKLLADSNDSRASVIKAVEDIKGCRNLDQAGDDLRDAARQREELVTRLQELKLDKLPDHAKLSAALTKAWKSSADADNSYAAWADDVGDGKKNCKDGQAKNTPNAVDGNKSSGEATRAKDSAAGMWNSIAAKYGLTKRDKSQL
ncbi:hypothetical protein ACIQF5_08795 [Streptomyces goshikiensis]|uniref:hypothetical protein n=1 Tax=Streptomyces goshikiensis TaxID=1942 RepID=UPI0037F76163